MRTILHKVLKMNETEARVQEIQRPVLQTTQETMRKIDQVNTLLQKTRTFYLAKAMGSFN